jgi:simple sugar transport system ATP-binding protein
MVHQHFMLVHNLTVLENIMLGMQSRFGPFLDKKGIAVGVNRLMTQYGLSVDLNSEICSFPLERSKKSKS